MKLPKIFGGGRVASGLGRVASGLGTRLATPPKILNVHSVPLGITEFPVRVLRVFFFFSFLDSFA